MAKRISVINFKGGVGKTTFAFQFAAGLARYHEGTRVLLVDMDHQSSLSIICLTAAQWVKIVKAERTVNAVFKPFIGLNFALSVERLSGALHMDAQFQAPVSKPITFINVRRMCRILSARRFEVISLRYPDLNEHDAARRDWLLLNRWQQVRQAAARVFCQPCVLACWPVFC